MLISVLQENFSAAVNLARTFIENNPNVYVTEGTLTHEYKSEELLLAELVGKISIPAEEKISSFVLVARGERM